MSRLNDYDPLIEDEDLDDDYDPYYDDPYYGDWEGED